MKELLTRELGQLRVQYPSGCGNAPKKELLIDFNIAFARGEVGDVLDFLTDNVVWEMIGDRTLHGKKEIEPFLKDMSRLRANHLLIQQVITHGKDAGAHGVLDFGQHHRVAFADFYEFASAGSNNIKRITSYAISVISDFS